MQNRVILEEINKFIIANPNTDFTVRVGKGIVVCEVKK
jgi:hypothetical protein